MKHLFMTNANSVADDIAAQASFLNRAAATTRPAEAKVRKTKQRGAEIR